VYVYVCICVCIDSVRVRLVKCNAVEVFFKFRSIRHKDCRKYSLEAAFSVLENGLCVCVCVCACVCMYEVIWCVMLIR